MEIQVLNPTTPRHRQRIATFLQQNGLRLDTVDYYAAVVDESTDEMIAGGGLDRNIIKCVAVADGHKGEAIANTLVSHLIAHANAEGHTSIKLFTKPENRRLFESLSFRLLAEAPKAILMETGIGGIETVERALKSIAAAHPTTNESGVIVMNCNPFTLGHRYLIEQAAQRVAWLYVIVVREDCSLFGYEERAAMVRKGTADLQNVVVVDGNDYAISRATFPTYFLKRLDDAADTQMLLDLDLYRRHIAPALGATTRFVGTEPTDALTRRYNELMRDTLSAVSEINRCEHEGKAVSASSVRKAMDDGNMTTIRQLVPPTTLPYIIAHLATNALQAELDTTPKPGLVDRHDNGAHHDMDYALMQRSIRALHPYFVRLAVLGFAATTPPHTDIQRIGIEAEQAMFRATHGVNTHKGALFSMGLAVVASAHAEHEHSPYNAIVSTVKAIASAFPDTNDTHGSRVRRLSEQGNTIKGALDNAREGYEAVFRAWLPYYIERRNANDPYALHKTLLRIMCDLDDTNVIYRTDIATASKVKREAQALLNDFSEEALAEMNLGYTALNVSPGGAADMLSLTVFCSNFY